MKYSGRSGGCPWLRPYLFIGMALLVLVVATGLACGITWEQEKLHYPGSEPTVAADGDNVYLVWTGWDGADPYLLYTWYNGSYWQGVGYVNTLPTSMMEPDIAADNGVLHVVWAEAKDGDFDIFYSNFDGETWSSIIQLNADRWSDDQRTPAITVVGKEVHVIWYDEGTRDRGVHYRHFDGRLWEGQEKVSDDTVPTAGGEEHIDVAADEDEVHIVWGTDDQIVKYRSLDRRGWGSVESLDFGATVVYMNQPCVATTREVVYVAWDDMADGINMTSNDGSGWSVPEVIGPRTSDYLEAPYLAAEEGHVVLAWGSSPNGDVHLRHFNGAVWTDHEIADNITTGRQDIPHLDLEDGVVHLTFMLVDSGAMVYTRKGYIEMEPPASGVSRSGPYWTDVSGTDLDWWAQDDFALADVTIESRHSTDNETWSEWAEAMFEDGENGITATGTYHFDPTDGDGYYEFRTVARDVMGNTEVEHIAADTIAGRDTMAPTGAFEPFGTISPARVVQLNITYDDAHSGVVMMRFAWEDSWGDVDWLAARTDPGPFTFPDETGNHTLFGQVMDVVGHVSETFNITVWMDLDDPLCAIDIVGSTSDVSGDKYVDTSMVTLHPSFWELAGNSGIASMRLSNDGVWDTEDWEPTATDVAWTLTPGDGARTVHLQVMDRVGHVSEIATDTVVVDTSDPYTHSVEPDDGDTDVDVNTVITAQFSEEMDPATIGGAFSLTWVDGTQVVAVQGAFEWTQEGRTLTFTPDEPLEMGVSYHISIGQDATDIAGNGLYPAIDNSFSTSEQPGSDTEPPTGTISIGEGIFFHNSTQITIFLTYEDDTGVDSIRLSNDAVWDDEEWQTPAGSVAWQLPDGEGSRTVRYQVRDITGKVSDTYSTSFKVDMTGPRLEAMDPADGADGVAVNASIRMVFSEVLKPIPMKADLTIYWIDEDERSHDLVGELTWKSDWRTFTFEPFSDLEEGTTYYIRLGPDTQDLAGNSLYPAVSTSFTTEVTGGDGNGDGGGDGDEGGISGLVIALVGMIVVLIVVVAIFMMRQQKAE